MTDFEPLLREISSRLDALGQRVDDNHLRQMVADQFNLLVADPEAVRKIRFGGQAAPELAGTKFSRWGLSVADIEWLYDVTTSAAQRNMGPGPSEQLRNAFESVSKAVYMSEAEIRAIDKQAIDGLYPRIPKEHFSAADLRVLARGGRWQDTSKYAELIRAMDTAESGYGQQLVGAQYVGELWQVARADSRIFGLINSFEMTAPTAYLPVEVDFPEMLFVTESTANNSANYTTVKTGSNRIQVDAKKFVIHQMWSGEMEEDSLVPFVPFLRGQIVKSIAHYSDSLVLNGDTTNAGTGNINLDDADPADTKHYLAFDGIRHAGLVDNTNNRKDAAGAVTWDLLLGQRTRMADDTYLVDWGHPFNPNDLIYVADYGTADKITLLDEVKTADKYQANATVLTGEVTKIGRHPLIVSMAMSKTEADGKCSTTGGSNVKGQVVAFNRNGFITGWRRRVKAETQSIPGTDQQRIVYSLRLGFGRFTPTGAASGIEAADVLYDIDLT